MAIPMGAAVQEKPIKKSFTQLFSRSANIYSALPVLAPSKSYNCLIDPNDVVRELLDALPTPGCGRRNFDASCARGDLLEPVRYGPV